MGTSRDREGAVGWGRLLTRAARGVPQSRKAIRPPSSGRVLPHRLSSDYNVAGFRPLSQGNRMWRPIIDALAGRLSGRRALAQACEQNRIERFFTFSNFEQSAQRWADQMHAAGL